MPSRVKTNPLYAPAFYPVLAVLFLVLFVLNVCTHGTTLGLISTCGGAALLGFNAYRAWSRKRREKLQ